MNSKIKSTILFVVIVLLIGTFSYIGARGIDNIFGYKVKSFNDLISKGLDLRGGVSIVLEAKDVKLDRDKDGNVTDDPVQRTIQVLDLRINKLGVSETSVTKDGNNRIRIEMPGKYDPKEVTDTVVKTGKLEFKGPDNVVILTGSDVKTATAYLDDRGANIVGLEFNEGGAKKFRDATEKFLGQKIGIYMDGELLTNPTVQSIINEGKAQITGSRTAEEAKQQAGIIKSGALPVDLKVVSSNVVGSTLGEEAIPQSVKAGIVGIGLVLLFMVIYYRVPGLIANISLVVYILLVLGAFSILGVTLTLPGIAGFLLTVGMAVDANVLIFERMREELKTGKSVKSSIDAGFHRAMSSILDGNITTIIAGAVLAMLGTGAVKGFAITLIVGVVLSMFTAITFTRFMIKLAVSMGWFNKKWTIGTFGVHDVRRG